MEFPNVIIEGIPASSASDKGTIVKSNADGILPGTSFEIGLSGPVVSSEIILPTVNTDSRIIT